LYSRRLPWSVSQNRISEEIAALRRSDRPLLDLTGSNPTKAGLNYPHDRIARALSHISDYTYDPLSQGSADARAAIARDYGERGLDVAPEQIFLTASTSEAYAHLFKVLCDPGDEVLAPVPSYPLFEFLASLENVRPVPYQLQYDGSWHIDFASLDSRLTSRTRSVIVVSPNNPTGSVLKEDDVAQLTRIALGHDLAIISDEVFLDYSLQPAAHSAKSLAGGADALTFSLSGLSKSAGMPQMKLGWIVASGPAAKVHEASERLETVLDTYLSVNTPVERALPELLPIGRLVRKQIQQRIRENLETLRRLLHGTAASPLTVEAGWSAIVQVPRTRTEEDWVLTILREQSVIVQPGYFFDMPSEAFLVVSLITPPADFREGIERLVALIEQSEHSQGEC
jgi:aspartate/methionine/tyrosine aminotransferase